MEEEEYMPELKLISDQPLLEGSQTRTDGLGFEIYSNILGDAAAQTQGPFTIGVFGEWGTGKTSLLRLIERRLNGKEDILTVWFNAWRYEKEEHPIVPLIATIVKRLDESPDFMQKMSEYGKSLVKALKSVACSFTLKATGNIPGIGGLEMEMDGSKFIDKMATESGDTLLSSSLYFDVFDKLSKLSQESNCKIVVIIDDLDRCFPEKAVRLLESIKLVLAQKAFVFVIAVARSIIEGYLANRYTKEYGITDFAGQEYLDKMVQLPFHIPPHDHRLENFYKALIDQINMSNKETFGEILPIIGAACGNNPRNTIRFLNNLIVDSAIYTELFPNDPDTSPLGALAICRSLQQRWKDVYAILLRTPQLCNEVYTWDDKNVLADARTSEDPSTSKVANEIANDLSLDALLYSTYGNEWLQDEGLRIKCTQYIETRSRATDTIDEETTPPDPLPPPDRPSPDASPQVPEGIHDVSADKRKPNAAFVRPMKLSPELADVVGARMMPRTEVTKRLWLYIKKHDLQDKRNRRNIHADDKLLRIFDGKKTVSMFEMTKLVSKHMK